MRRSFQKNTYISPHNHKIMHNESNNRQSAPINGIHIIYRENRPVCLVRGAANLPDSTMRQAEDGQLLSLADMLSQPKTGKHMLHLIQTQLPDVLADADQYDIRLSPLGKDTILYDTETDSLLPLAEENTARGNNDETLKDYGLLLQQAMNATGIHIGYLRRIARQCQDGTLTTPGELQLALERKNSNAIYATVILVILILCTLLALPNI